MGHLCVFCSNTIILIFCVQAILILTFFHYFCMMFYYKYLRFLEMGKLFLDYDFWMSFEDYYDDHDSDTYNLPCSFFSYPIQCQDQNVLKFKYFFKAIF
jgi:hypothetical protein